jgi:hypothetical protein
LHRSRGSPVNKELTAIFVWNNAWNPWQKSIFVSMSGYREILLKKYETEYQKLNEKQRQAVDTI